MKAESRPPTPQRNSRRRTDGRYLLIRCANFAWPMFNVVEMGCIWYVCVWGGKGAVAVKFMRWVSVEVILQLGLAS